MPTHHHLLRTAAVLALGSAALMACSAGNSVSSAAKAPSAATSSATAAEPSGNPSVPSAATSTGGGSHTSPSAGRATATVAGASPCRTAGLGFGYGPDSGPQVVGDTTAPEVVKLTNVGPLPCSLYGFPGVDLITSQGRISVPRGGQRPTRVVLKPGRSAIFDVIYPVNTGVGSGVRVSTMVITPPNETHSRTLAWGEGSLPVTAGLSPALEVGPVGPFPG